MSKNYHSLTRRLVFCAISITLSFVTSYIKFVRLPFGGSITLFSMFFICFAGYLYGTKTGLLTGLAYGILQFFQDPYVLSPLQVLFDYPLPFLCLGLAGAFRHSKYGLHKGILLGVTCRYLCHAISGYVFFGTYAPEGMHPVLYSAAYNLTYILPELIATLFMISLPAVKKALAQVQRMALEG